MEIDIPSKLLAVLRGFPTAREVEHCGRVFEVSPFDIYATCPKCQVKIKVRSFSDVVELEDVFDAVFEWMERAKADDLVGRRRREISEDLD